MSVLYWHQTGPKIAYANEMFEVEDLNPENRIAFAMSKDDMRSLALAILSNVNAGTWPYWGDSPNGFDGPGGAE
jgi:hypothetical protein